MSSSLSLIQSESEAGSWILLSTEERSLSTKDSACPSDSPVTYSLGQPSPCPVTPRPEIAWTQTVAVSDRSAEACRNTDLNGIASDNALSPASLAMTRQVFFDGEAEFRTVLQGNRFELPLTLPLTDTVLPVGITTTW